jgi:hypothetical protein
VTYKIENSIKPIERVFLKKIQVPHSPPFGETNKIKAFKS